MPNMAHAIASAEPHWPAPGSVVKALAPSLVWGWSGGAIGTGMSAFRLYQARGSSLAASVNLISSPILAPFVWGGAYSAAGAAAGSAGGQDAREHRLPGGQVALRAERRLHV